MNLFKKKAVAGLPQQRYYAARRLGPAWWKMGLAGAGVILFALFLGLVAAVGGVRSVVVIAGAMTVIPLIWFVRARTLLPLLFVFMFVIQGAASTLLHIKAISWVASGLAFLFLARVLLELFLTKLRGKQDRETWTGAAAIVLMAVIYLMFFFFGLVTNSATLPQRVSAVRFGVPMFGVLLLLANAQLSEGRMRLLWNLVMAINVVQLPIVAYQHFFGMGGLGWDAVVGSFGPGMSAVMVLFCVSAVLYSLAMWSRGLMSMWVMLLVSGVAVANMLLGEVKAVVFWVPIGVVLVMRARFFRNLGSLIVYSAVLVLFVVGTYSAYKAMYWGEQSGTVADQARHTSGYFFDPYEMHYDTGEVGRFASLHIWYRDPTVDMVHRMIGYGPGAVAVSQTVGRGMIAQRYRPLAIASTALSVLLWDVGVLGTLTFVAMFVFAIWAGWRYVARGEGTPQGRAMVDTSIATLVLLFSTLIYNRTLVDENTVQLLFMFCIGCIVHQCRFGRTVASPATANVAARPGLPASSLTW